jgi:hypothetical protein
VSAPVTPGEGPSDPGTAPGTSIPGTDPATPGPANPGRAQASQVGSSDQSRPVPWHAAPGEFDDNVPKGVAAGHSSTTF